MPYDKLKKSREFSYVYRNGEKWVGRYVVILYVKNPLPGSRIGIVVSKKVGTAVVRNKIKRRLKEIIRLNQDRIPEGLDIVIVAKSKAKVVSFWDLMDDLLKGFKEIEKDETSTPFSP